MVYRTSYRQWLVAQCADHPVVAGYALRDMNKPIGVAEYQLVQALPDELQTDLPRIEDIERELRDANDGFGDPSARHPRSGRA